jgi:lysophospholipase L1-like esterase
MSIFLSILGIVLLTIFLIEIVFRIRHRDFQVSPKIPWDRVYVTAHPFLSFAYKRHAKVVDNKIIPYPLHKGQFRSFLQPMKLNNLGHFGDDVAPEKLPGTLRIACLGASTTANNISDGKKDYSYPGLLQQKLGENLDQVPEVLNCGIGGWVSADILVNFCLNIVHLKPDYVVLYHGANDIPLHLMSGVRTDYSHGRKNLGEVLHLIHRANILPKIPFWQSYEFAKNKISGTGDVRNDVLYMIQKQPVDFEKVDPWQSLWIEKENLRNILVLCRENGIKAVIGSFCYYAYEDTPRDKIFSLGVTEENHHLQSLASEFDTVFVDQAALIPREDQYFVDTVHFTPNGMELLAENFYKAIIDDHRKTAN